MKTMMAVMLLLLAAIGTIGMTLGLEIGDVPSNAENISETNVVNESASVVGMSVLGNVPGIIDLNDRNNVSFEASVYTDKDSKQTIVTPDHKLWIVPDNEFTNSTDVEFIIYNSTEGYAVFEVVGGFVRESTGFTLLSTDGDNPLQCASENAGEDRRAHV